MLFGSLPLIHPTSVEQVAFLFDFSSLLLADIVEQTDGVAWLLPPFAPSAAHRHTLVNADDLIGHSLLSDKTH